MVREGAASPVNWPREHSLDRRVEGSGTVRSNIWAIWWSSCKVRWTHLAAGQPLRCRPSTASSREAPNGRLPALGSLVGTVVPPGTVAACKETGNPHASKLRRSKRRPATPADDESRNLGNRIATRRRTASASACVSPHRVAARVRARRPFASLLVKAPRSQTARLSRPDGWARRALGRGRPPADRLGAFVAFHFTRPPRHP